MKTSSSLTTILVIASYAIAADWGCKTELGMPGDTCDSFAKKHGLTPDELVAFNPQLGSLKDCPANMVAWNVYCVGPKDSTSQPSTQAQNQPSSQPVQSRPASQPASQPPRATTSAPASTPRRPAQTPTTVYVTSTLSAKLPTKTVTQPPSTVTTTTCVPPSPKNPICATNLCWRAYVYANGRVASSQIMWCSSVLSAKPPITQEKWDPYLFPGIPNFVSYQCQWISEPASVVVSSYCRCYTSGQMNVGRQTG
ncbi:hypothetical protein GE09DRAFT_1225058 [Coniochaeta sp. 2T2.1]|nr:hypothetical protein GE09DRAFT_1225058 [Coniochaeta sp. 2T2.1]